MVSYYDYNPENLMDEFTDGTNTAYYTFDADNRRVKRVSGATTEKYLLAGMDVIADYDGSNTLQATYNTPGLDRNLSVKRGGNVYHFTRAGLGSIRELLDSSEV